jgi:hypothetical protein
MTNKKQVVSGESHSDVDFATIVSATNTPTLWDALQDKEHSYDRGFWLRFDDGCGTVAGIQSYASANFDTKKDVGGSRDPKAGTAETHVNADQFFSVSSSQSAWAYNPKGGTSVSEGAGFYADISNDANTNSGPGYAVATTSKGQSSTIWGYSGSDANTGRIDSGASDNWSLGRSLVTTASVGANDWGAWKSNDVSGHQQLDVYNSAYQGKGAVLTGIIHHGGVYDDSTAGTGLNLGNDGSIGRSSWASHVMKVVADEKSSLQNSSGYHTDTWGYSFTVADYSGTWKNSGSGYWGSGWYLEHDTEAAIDHTKRFDGADGSSVIQGDDVTLTIGAYANHSAGSEGTSNTANLMVKLTRHTSVEKDDADGNVISMTSKDVELAIKPQVFAALERQGFSFRTLADEIAGVGDDVMLVAGQVPDAFASAHNALSDAGVFGADYRTGQGFLSAAEMPLYGALNSMISDQSSLAHMAGSSLSPGHLFS